jgi:hypothetical protein
MPQILVEILLIFARTFILLHICGKLFALKVRAAASSQLLVDILQTTWPINLTVRDMRD